MSTNDKNFTENVNIEETVAEKSAESTGGPGFLAPVVKAANACGTVAGLLIDGGAKSIRTMIETILPCFAFVSLLVGIVLYSGVADIVGGFMSQYMNSIWGVLIVACIIGIPVISPLVAAGVAIPGVLAMIVGTMISSGTLQPVLALSALFAIDSACVCDFIAPGLAMGEAEPDTIAIAYPAMMFSHLVVAPIAVLLAYGISLLTGFYVV